MTTEISTKWSVLLERVRHDNTVIIKTLLRTVLPAVILLKERNKKEIIKHQKPTCYIRRIELERSSAVTQCASRRRLQFIHVEISTVSDSDVYLPPTTVAPIKTNLTADNALLHCGMFTVEPARSMCTTEIRWHAWFWHGATCPCRETVPLGGQTTVTYGASIASITWCCAVRLVEEGVRAALCDWKWLKKIGEVVLFYFNTILISKCLFCCSMLLLLLLLLLYCCFHLETFSTGLWWLV